MRNNKGIALLMALAMISSLVGVIMICAFVLGHEANKDQRYEITRQRMLKVKRALIGRMADVAGGEDITSCGGFISDYGEPGDINSFINNNFVPVLLDEPDGYLDWNYDSTHKFWHGYRTSAANDGYYLKAPPAQPNPTTHFLDGWGYGIEVNFVDDDNINGIEDGENKMTIKSKGDDNLWDTEPGADTTYYGKDIVDAFYWRRQITVTNNTGFPNVRLIYSFQGTISTEDRSVNPGPVTFATEVPVGLRKLEVRDALNVLQQTKVFCLPPGENAYPVTID
ncbi:MAG: hypothetical protein AB1630_08380 [bacterium]